MPIVRSPDISSISDPVPARPTLGIIEIEHGSSTCMIDNPLSKPREFSPCGQVNTSDELRSI